MTQVGSQIFGIVVDGVFHTEEIVVKPMSTKLRHIPMFSGNTILGDGSVIMIIDPNGLAQSDRQRRDDEALASMRREAQQADDGSERVACCVFRAGSPQPKAVPLVTGHAAGGGRRQDDRDVQRPADRCNIAVSSCRWSGQRRRADQE